VNNIGMVESGQVNPELPEGFWFTPNEERPASHLAWWGKPLILTGANPYFPDGMRYDVYCLDGESSDRPSLWGMFGTLEEAVERAREGPPWLRSKLKEMVPKADLTTRQRFLSRKAMASFGQLSGRSHP